MKHNLFNKETISGESAEFRKRLLESFASDGHFRWHWHSIQTEEI